MTRENRNLLINTILVIIVSTILLLSFIFYMPTTGADKVFKQKVSVVDKGYFRLPPNIEKVEDVYNKKDEHLGVLYTVSDENPYGPITLKVAIDDNGRILGIYQLVEQNYPESHHSLEVHKYVESLSGSKISNPQSITIDKVAKPTTSITLGTINNILDIIAVHAHFKEPEAPVTDPVEIYENLSSELESLTKIDVTNDIIEEKYEGYNGDNDLIGYFYMARSDNQFGHLTVTAFVDTEGKLVKTYAYDINQSLHLDSIKDFINNYTDFSDELDGFAGVTFAKESFQEILDAIKDSHEISNLTADVEFVEEEENVYEYINGGR